MLNIILSAEYHEILFSLIILYSIGFPLLDFVNMSRKGFCRTEDPGVL